MWMAAAPPPFGLPCRGRLDSRGGCHLVTSGWSSAWRVPGKCSPRRPDATPPPGCEGVQPGSPSALLPSFEAVALAGPEQGGEVPPPDDPQRASAGGCSQGASGPVSGNLCPPSWALITGKDRWQRDREKRPPGEGPAQPGPPRPSGRACGGEGRGGHRRREGGGSSVCGRRSRPVLRAGPGSLSMVLSFGVLRRLPLCRCECAPRPVGRWGDLRAPAVVT